MTHNEKVESYKAYFQTGDPQFIPSVYEKTAHVNEVQAWKDRWSKSASKGKGKGDCKKDEEAIDWCRKKKTGRVMAAKKEKEARAGHPANVALARALSPGILPGLNPGGSKVHASHNGDFNHDIAAFIEEGVDPGTRAYLRGEKTAVAGKQDKKKKTSPDPPEKPDLEVPDSSDRSSSNPGVLQNKRWFREDEENTGPKKYKPYANLPSSKKRKPLPMEDIPAKKEASVADPSQDSRSLSDMLRAFVYGEKTAADSVVGKPRRTQKGNLVPDPAPAPPSEQQPLGPIDPPYTFNTPDQAKKKWRSPYDMARDKKVEEASRRQAQPHRYAPDDLRPAIQGYPPWYDYQRPQRGVPGADKELTRKQWYENAMSDRYNKGQISEQEYQEFLKPKHTGAGKTLRSILGGIKHIGKRYGEDFMKGTPDTAGTAADRTLEGSGK
jgi:hypothetical protein